MDQEGLVDIFQGIFLFAYHRGQRLQTDRSAIKLIDDSQHDPTVHLIQTESVDPEHVQGRIGDLLVSALMEKRREDPKSFAPIYEGLLAGGGSKTYVEALAPFGLDPREKVFWSRGCDRLAGLIDEFEALGA